MNRKITTKKKERNNKGGRLCEEKKEEKSLKGWVRVFSKRERI